MSGIGPTMGQLKIKMQDCKMLHQKAEIENVGPNNYGKPRFQHTSYSWYSYARAHIAYMQNVIVALSEITSAYN